MTQLIRTGQLTREMIEVHLDEFLRLSEICWSELGQQAWSKENYLMEFPLKWQLSRYAHTLTFPENIVGCVMGHYRQTGYGKDRVDGLGYAFVSKVAVFPDYRGKKATTEVGMSAGASMLDEFTKKCLDFHINEIRLGVFRENSAAVKLYEKMNYKIIGEQVGTDNQVRLVMSLDLSNKDVSKSETSLNQVVTT